MGFVSYQAVFNKKFDFRKKLIALLKETYQEFYDEVEEETIEPYIFIKYIKELNEDKSISGFDLAFDKIVTGIDDFIETYNSKLKDDENIIVVFKFYDSALFDKLQRYYKDLFDLEMKLREIITFIFIDTYKGNFYDLLNEVNVNPCYPNERKVTENKRFRKKDLLKNLVKRKEYLDKFSENQFFYFLFSQYKRTTELKTLNQGDLFFIAEISNNFNEFKNNILNRGITNQEYLSFLNSIKRELDNLENIRNCVAHNRIPSENEVYNYESSLSSVENKIEEFLSKLRIES